MTIRMQFAAQLLAMVTIMAALFVGIVTGVAAGMMLCEGRCRFGGLGVKEIWRQLPVTS